MYVELGKIVGVWGVKGWVKLHSYTRQRSDISQYETWFLSRHKKGPEHDSGFRQISVLQCREQAKGIVAQLQNVDDRDKAAAMSGFGIWVKQSDLPDLPEGEFYWQQLIGLVVSCKDGVSNKETEIGTVQSILETGANDVLVCKQSSHKASDGEKLVDVLIPYTDDVVLDIDIAAGTMMVDWDPECLLD